MAYKEIELQHKLDMKKYRTATRVMEKRTPHFFTKDTVEVITEDIPYYDNKHGNARIEGWKNRNEL